MSWLVTKKDARGTWHSTQATVLSLKALVTGTGKPLGGDAERHVTVKVGEQTQDVVIAADQAEVMKLIDVTKWLKAGDTDVSLKEKSKTAPGYQVVFRYHVPEPKADNKEPLSIAIDYDMDSLTVGETVKAEATVTNRMKTTAPMVMVDLPVPPGFARCRSVREAGEGRRDRPVSGAGAAGAGVPAGAGAGQAADAALLAAGDDAGAGDGAGRAGVRVLRPAEGGVQPGEAVHGEGAGVNVHR